MHWKWCSPTSRSETGKLPPTGTPVVSKIASHSSCVRAFVGNPSGMLSWSRHPDPYSSTSVKVWNSPPRTTARSESLARMSLSSGLFFQYPVTEVDGVELGEELVERRESPRRLVGNARPVSDRRVERHRLSVVAQLHDVHGSCAFGAGRWYLDGDRSQ